MVILWFYSTIAVIRDNSSYTSIAYFQKIIINKTEERINPFAIGYMINSTLHVNKVFIDKVENT